MKPLVACFGNTHRGDDAFGLCVADRLRGAGVDADVIAVRSDALSLLEAWRGREQVIIVDAIQIDRPAGTIMRFDLSDEGLAMELSGTSTHALGPGGAVEMARVLGELPPRVEIVAAAGHAFGQGVPMSDALQDSIDPVVEEIRAMIER